MADLDSTGNDGTEGESPPIESILEPLRMALGMPEGSTEDEIFSGLESLALCFKRIKQDQFDSDIPPALLDSLTREIMQMSSDRPEVKLAFKPHLQEKMIPLYCIPRLFCAAFDDESPSYRRCIAEWSEIIAMAALYGEIWPCDPDSWLALSYRRGLTARSVVGLNDLIEWARDEFQLSISADGIASETPDRPSNARSMRADTKIKVIAALLGHIGRDKRPSAKQLEAVAQAYGITVSDDSIRKAIDLALEEMGEVPPK